VINELLIGKDLEGSGCGLILRYYPGISLWGLRKTTKSQDSRSPGRDLNSGTPEYEAGVLCCLQFCTCCAVKSVYICMAP
jgi:hypothetical protein